jgi:hypothetical protein
MDNELLYAKIAAMEGKRPLAHRSSRRRAKHSTQQVAARNACTNWKRGQPKRIGGRGQRRACTYR